jgi:hypothetical protein
MADNRHDITMPARRGPQNAKTILNIMVRDALDETGKNLLRLILGRMFHGRCGRITSCTHVLKPTTGQQHWSRDLEHISLGLNRGDSQRFVNERVCRH